MTEDTLYVVLFFVALAVYAVIGGLMLWCSFDVSYRADEAAGDQEWQVKR